MKSLWDSITVYGSGIDELNSKAKAVGEAFARFVKRRNSTAIPEMGIVQFANGTGTYSFAAFLWPEGTLAKHKAQGYCVTKGWDPTEGMYCWKVRVALPDGLDYNVNPEDLEKADIPQDVMKLAVNQMKAKCSMMKGDCE